MDRATAKSIMQEVVANRKRLEACKKHKFIITEKLQRTCVCINCGGQMSRLDATHYRDGYVAHGGNAKDVFEYFI